MEHPTPEVVQARLLDLESVIHRHGLGDQLGPAPLDLKQGLGTRLADLRRPVQIVRHADRKDHQPEQQREGDILRVDQDWPGQVGSDLGELVERRARVHKARDRERHGKKLERSLVCTGRVVLLVPEVDRAAFEQ